MIMKKNILIFLVLMMTAPVALVAKQLSAVFSYSTFALAGGSPYVETYLSFDAWNMTFVKTAAGKYQATVEITLVAKRSDSIVYAKKYELNSPAINSPEEDRFNFIDLHRFALANGIYDLEMVIKDKASNEQPVVINEKIAVLYDATTPRLSSVQPMASIQRTMKENVLSRNGYDMEPYVNDFYPEQMKTLSFYYEIYNIQKEVGRDKEFLAVAFIEDAQFGKRFAPSFATKKYKSSEVVPVYASLDISALPSGNYNLVVEVRNRQNEMVLFSKVPFFRSNPSVEDDNIDVNIAGTFAAMLNDENMLNYYIEALYPISSVREQHYEERIVKEPGKLAEKQSFFYNFWKGRNALDPESAWKEYKTRLDYVAVNFSYPRTPGYLTDRGRVYLQYGPPDFIRDEKNFVSTRYLGSMTNMERELVGENKNNASLGQIFYLPYQLWRYNRLPGDDPNRVFLFWDELRSGFYKLLNSNARGEVRDPKWEQRLSQQQLNEDLKGEVGEQFDRGY